MSIIKIGKISAPVGIKGELRVYPYADSPERFGQIEAILLGGRRVEIETARVMKNMAVIKLRGVDDRNSAEALRGAELFIAREELWEMPEDTYFTEDLLGCKVIREDGSLCGTLAAVHANPAHDLYEIRTGSGRSFLLPAVGEFVLSVDIRNKIIIVHLIEGMEEL
ncbi:MAG TPA: ribosome maturation factor RimM [Bacillota bacterium]|nr:ribosome maturation factor RimM [Bacillota bacterium]